MCEMYWQFVVCIKFDTLGDVTSEVNSTNNSDSTEFDAANSYDCTEIMVNWIENDAVNASKIFNKFQMNVLE